MRTVLPVTLKCFGSVELMVARALDVAFRISFVSCYREILLWVD